MTAFPLCILALAAGVYLLIKVNREYLGGMFKFLAWLIIVLSVLALAGSIHHAARHHRLMKMHSMEFIHGEGGCGEMCGARMGDMHCGDHGSMPGPGMGACCIMHKDSACPMGGCKMVGDSIVLDHAMCEKIMGKEACDKLCKERGQCIVTKDECAKMCSGGKACCKK